MSNDYRTRPLLYVVSACPACAARHEYGLEVCYRVKIILFGGQQTPRAVGAAGTSWPVTLKCPTTDEPFRVDVIVQPLRHEDVVEVRQAPSPGSAPASSPLPALASSVVENSFNSDVVRAEAQEWIKASPNVARDVCKTLLGTSLGAIPIFFAVLKFLGVEKPSPWLPAWLSVLPPVLFLCSAALFLRTLLPEYAEATTVGEFEAFRTRRIALMDRMIKVGVGLFLTGLAVAISIFVFLVLP